MHNSTDEASAQAQSPIFTSQGPCVTVKGVTYSVDDVETLKYTIPTAHFNHDCDGDCGELILIGSHYHKWVYRVGGEDGEFIVDRRHPDCAIGDHQ